MKHYTNEFMGYTTIVLEIEKNLDIDSVVEITDELNNLAFGKFKPSCYLGPLQVINKHDEDICIGHKFVIMSRQNQSAIQAIITDISEIVEAA